MLYIYILHIYIYIISKSWKCSIYFCYALLSHTSVAFQSTLLLTYYSLVCVFGCACSITLSCSWLCYFLGYDITQKPNIQFVSLVMLSFGMSAFNIVSQASLIFLLFVSYIYWTFCGTLFYVIQCFHWSRSGDES